MALGRLSSVGSVFSRLQVGVRTILVPLHQGHCLPVLANCLPSRTLSSSVDIATTIKQYDCTLPVEEASTPPSAWYNQPAALDQEKKSVFKHNWIVVGRSDQLQKPGDYFTGCLLSEPFLVCMDQDGVKRAFFNACRHHGTRVTSEESGSVKNFVCPYHAWTYDLTGRLIKAKRLKGIKNFTASKIGLHGIALQEEGPFLYLNFAAPPPARPAPRRRRRKLADAEDVDVATAAEEAVEFQPQLSTVLGDLPAVLNGTNYNDLQFVVRRTYKMDCNWKVFVDNYLDGGYHVEHAHRDLSGSLDLDSYTTTVQPYYSIQEAKGAAASSASVDSLNPDARLGDRAVYAFLYPNFMINRYGPWMDTNLVWPLSERQCLVHFDYFLDRSKIGDQAFIDQSLEASHKVQLEDMELCHAVQAGLDSSAFDTGRYAPTVEFPMYHFHKQLHKDLLESVC